MPDIVLDGILEKWTNAYSRNLYKVKFLSQFLRWQPRYFVLDKRGVLCYYLSKDHAKAAVSHRWAV
jgi:hypothetical protein